jgi:hypothetical protein
MELIANQAERATLGRNALAALESQRGATAKTIDALLALMDQKSAGNAQQAGGKR